MRNHVFNGLWRFLAAFIAALALVSLSDWVEFVFLAPVPAGAFLVGVFFGWPGIAGWLAGYAVRDYLNWQQKIEAGLIPKTPALEALPNWGHAAFAYTLIAISGYLVFRFSHRVGRGFPDWRSIAALGIASTVGSLATTITILKFSPLPFPWTWDLFFYSAVNIAASILFIAPPVMLVADRYLRAALVPLPHEQTPLRPFPQNLEIQPTLLDIPIKTWLMLVGVAIVAATSLVTSMTKVLAEIESWPLMGYLGIVLWTAFSFGVRGSLLASSLSAICYFSVRPFIDPTESVFDEGNIGAIGLYMQFATFYLVAIFMGMGREREMHLRKQMLARDRMSELLQSANDNTEAYRIVEQSLRKLFPRQRWALFSLDDDNLLRRVADSSDGDVQQAFSTQDCWALRMGQVHAVHEDGEGAICAHLDEGVESYICYPLIAHSETLGVLHLALEDPDEDFLQSLVRVISLSLGNIKAHQELKDQSIRDALTGLVNRRYLVEQLELEVARADREDREISLLILDIDHFKHFNDTYGHEAGDEVLRGVGQYLNAHARQGDVVCRYGGEEFVIVMPGAPIAVARRRADDFRRGIRDLRIKSRGQSLGQVTASFGVATWPVHGTGWRQVLEVADHALYEAKKGGRDRVEIAPAPKMAARSAVTA